MEFLFGDRKRKVEESDTEENQDVKKPHLEEPAEPKQEEIENGNQTKPTVDNDTQEGQDENYISLSVGDSLDGDNDAKEDDAEKEIASFMNLPPIETVVPFDRLVIVNVATNSDDFPGNHAHQVTKENAEIIELSFVIVNAKDMTILDTKQTYVKPERTPVTSQCTQATGIYPETLEYAKGLCDAVKVLQDYIENEIADKFTYCFVSHGAWTLRIQLPREAQDKGIELPGYLAYCKMFDIKQEIQRWQVHHPEISLRSMNLKDLCEAFRVQRATKPSAGLATCLTVVNLMRHLAGFQHPDVFAHPIDTNADLQQFKKEESKVIHLAGLPFEVTQGEVDAWFSSNGLRPTATWMIQTSDHSKPNVAGFVVFQTHADAMRALSLNGRCLSDRAIEVSPSSQRVIDAAGSMLVPFPLQPKGRSLRPGDWNCPSCNFYNYASRRTCYKCNAENPSPSPAALNQPPTHSSNTHHSQPQRFTPGDWICPNYSCGFHNYASRLQCHRCSTQRPPTSSGPHSYGHPAAPPMPAVSGGGGYGRPPNQPAFRPGDWYCPNPACNFQNFASRSICFKCQTPRPGPPPPPRQTCGGASMMPPQTAQPYSYSAAPSTYAAPASYGHSAYQQPSNSGYGYGQQQATTAQNAINYRVNDRYWSTASTTSYQTAPSSPAHENLPGDWTCPNGLCNFHNFAKRTQCAKCGTPAPAVRHTGTASGY